ncbi:hypothetical protein [Aeromonas veronii]|uniref:hypothetical protein n=1 Tax=Aeromonas veronii TaxID=654 RepID=UPI0024428E88|nr:hypothetical protein [Aeromonas veronii]
MITKSYIYNNLKDLDRLYSNSTSNKKKLYYSKLAMLELCGWIEETMDDIVQKCANRVLKEKTNRLYVEKQIIKPTYGFEYDKHFKKMLICVVGLIYIEKVESKVDQVKYTLLKSSLNNLKVARNREAHSHLKGITRTVDAPSVTLNNFNNVYDGLIDFEKNMKLLNL